jgi:hypothetical protein
MKIFSLYILHIGILHNYIDWLYDFVGLCKV